LHFRQCCTNNKVVGVRSSIKERKVTSFTAILLTRLGNPVWINVKKSMSRYKYSIPISQVSKDHLFGLRITHLLFLRD
uniref:Mitochondrial protein n=1 Tax=Brugia pahangi TaxID=6280 RepID=A0A0N4SZS8_BRUPA